MARPHLRRSPDLDTQLPIPTKHVGTAVLTRFLTRSVEASSALTLSHVASFVPLAALLPVVGYVFHAVPLVLNAGYPLSAAINYPPLRATMDGATAALTWAFIATFLLVFSRQLRSGLGTANSSTDPQSERLPENASSQRGRWWRLGEGFRIARAGWHTSKRKRFLALLLGVLFYFILLGAVAAAALILFWVATVPLTVVPGILVGLVAPTFFSVSTTRPERDFRAKVLVLCCVLALASVASAFLAPLHLRSVSMTFSLAAGVPSGRYILVGEDSDWLFLGTCTSPGVTVVAKSSLLAYDMPPTSPAGLLPSTPSILDLVNGASWARLVCDGTVVSRP